ncbi:MAG: CpaF family protein [Lachnospiraceae bacterium]|nr:CpaF family protein [Lachnospiraceae bacterium]MBP5184784.1 CpaF family protein [Lachnospiraceae bacterium]
MVNEDYNTLKQQLHDRILGKMDFSKELGDDDVKRLIDSEIALEARERYISLKQKQRLSKDLFNSLRKFDLIQDLLDDPEVTEIMINGPENVFVERNGRVEATRERFVSPKRLEDVAYRMAAVADRRINEATPVVDTRLPDGSRVNIVLKPVAVDGPIITIRKFSDRFISMDRLIELGSITQEAADFLKGLVEAGYSVIVSGGTGSGKTTFLNMLSGFIPEEERIVTIEDAVELKIVNHKNLVRLESRAGNREGANAVTIRDLIRASLRMRPDRVIVGEVRGVEAVDMLQAMNTGHDGSMSTIHANSAADVFSRLETMVLLSADLPLAAVRGQIASALDIVVQLGRMRDKSRKVLEICEVERGEEGKIKINPLFRFVESDNSTSEKVEGELKKVGELKKTRKLEAFRGREQS